MRLALCTGSVALVAATTGHESSIRIHSNADQELPLLRDFTPLSIDETCPRDDPIRHEHTYLFDIPDGALYSYYDQILPVLRGENGHCIGQRGLCVALYLGDMPQTGQDTAGGVSRQWSSGLMNEIFGIVPYVSKLEVPKYRDWGLRGWKLETGTISEPRLRKWFTGGEIKDILPAAEGDLESFKHIGRLLGYALLRNQPIPVTLEAYIYKVLVGLTPVEADYSGDKAEVENKRDELLQMQVGFAEAVPLAIRSSFLDLESIRSALSGDGDITARKVIGIMEYDKTCDVEFQDLLNSVLSTFTKEELIKYVHFITGRNRLLASYSRGDMMEVHCVIWASGSNQDMRLPRAFTSSQAIVFTSVYRDEAMLTRALKTAIDDISMGLV